MGAASAKRSSPTVCSGSLTGFGAEWWDERSWGVGRGGIYQVVWVGSWEGGVYQIVGVGLVGGCISNSVGGVGRGCISSSVGGVGRGVYIK